MSHQAQRSWMKWTCGSFGSWSVESWEETALTWQQNRCVCRSVNADWTARKWTLLYKTSAVGHILFYVSLQVLKENLSMTEPKAPIVKPDKRCIRIPRYLSLHNISITNVFEWFAKYICVQLVCKHSFLSLHIVFSNDLTESSLYTIPAAYLIWLNRKCSN